MNKPVSFSTGRAQGGIAALVVLVMLTVMLLGSLSFARMTEVGTLAGGNVAFKERATQMATIGINSAFAAVNNLPSSQQNIGGWYFASLQPLDADGLPQGVNWDAAATTPMEGAYEARYIVERLCTQAGVTNRDQQCLLKQDDSGASENGDISEGGGGGSGGRLDPSAGAQFRITIRVTGPKNTVTFTQVLTNRSS
jgi:type IV pilus assembly protein PilX